MKKTDKNRQKIFIKNNKKNKLIKKMIKKTCNWNKA